MPIDGFASRRLTTIALGVAAICAIAFGYFWLTPLALPAVQVDAGVCDPAQPLDASVRGYWGGDMYRLAIDQPENCAVSIATASVQRIGDHLFVRTRFYSPSGMYTGCHCRHRMNLRIPGLPRQEYRAHVYSWP